MLKMNYGTAGFRCDASLLPKVVFRCGILMGLKSHHQKKICGIMITASHNIDTDNGVKLIDSNGEMIDKKWQDYATFIVNSEDTYLDENINILKTKHNICEQQTATVIVGHDTRDSSLTLTKECISGLNYVKCNHIYVGYVTTPELHNYVVNSSNYNYIKYITCTFNKPKNTYSIDCANGVGALKLLNIFSELKANNITLYNIGNNRLNHLCGADYVEKTKSFPINMENIKDGEVCFSIDGDADRVVVFTKRNDKLLLLNGDRIAVLFAMFLKNKSPESNIGIVQTGYSNGASTKYIIENLKLPVKVTKTGVEHLHNEAKNYEKGIYFESNGHGTILGYERLCQYTGDAIANIFLIMEILDNYISFSEWVNMYTDLPSKQTKVHMKCKFKLSEDETRCIEPEGLQQKIDNILCCYESARGFIRPSGTEQDTVRIYVEAVDELYVDQITNKIQQILKEF